MGVLDDAIREHLELKRKHGVPEEELQRQEEEALGPARRDVARQREEAELADGQAATDGAADESPAPAADQETALFDMEADTAPSAEAPAAREAESTPVEPPPVDAPPGPSAAESPPLRAVELREHDEAAVGEPGHEPDPHDVPGDTEPHGFEVAEEEEGLEDEEPAEPEPDEEELLSAEEEAAAEEGDPDVLEDTPDFLQETPEHDRLWFEQKPPRDFDFD